MSRGFIQSFADAGRIIESGGKGKPVEKTCAACGCGIDRRKTYCGPCYDTRLMANIAKNRHKYRK